MHRQLFHIVSAPFCHLSFRGWLMVAFLGFGLLFDAELGLAQSRTTPLSNLTPLQELEIRPNELSQLSTAYADVLRELKIARLNLDTLNALRGNTVVSQLEVQIAQINVRIAESKLAILQAIVKKQMVAAKAKLEILEQLERVGEKTPEDAPQSSNRIQTAQVRATIDILQMILDLR